MKKHVNIPIFIPHLGCPNQCVFCNQHTISGVDDFLPENVDDIINEALKTISPDTEVEIAFFGGSFTGIDRLLMIGLLSIAYQYVESGRVSSIRLSTRPDYINSEILSILKRYGVKTIELGLQSVSERVLEKTKRGHTFEDELSACRMIVDEGFDLVGQMMVGLPGSTIEDEISTARFIISMGAVGARIYPTVVFRDTELACMAERGEYNPISESDAIMRSAEVLAVFVEKGIDVIRIGLCASDNILSSDTYLAGPNHPALGELIIGEYYYSEIRNKVLNSDSTGGVLFVKVSPGSTSKALGQKKKNKIRLINEFEFDDIIILESGELSGYELITYIERKQQCT